jgi:hypothetical protein
MFMNQGRLSNFDSSIGNSVLCEGLLTRGSTTKYLSSEFRQSTAVDALPGCQQAETTHACMQRSGTWAVSASQLIFLHSDLSSKVSVRL